MLYCGGLGTLAVEVVLATIKGANGKSRVSAYTLQSALLEFFTEFKLFPTGSMLIYHLSRAGH